MINQKLHSGQELSNLEVREIFGCSLQGGMNRSLKTNTLVLISNKVKSIYQDRLDGDTIYYTGMGQEGDQDLNYAQNKTLSESNENGVNIHLFEKFEEAKYTYFGEVVLAGKPFQEIQPDSNNLDRKVWMFPLRLKAGYEIQPIPENKLKTLDQVRTKTISSLPRELIQSRARLASKKPGAREVKSTQYQRNEYVVEEAKRRADGICQLCEKPAPFIKKNKEPYLEVHHIVWLAKGGEDTLENTVALCPNCHRRMHVLDSDEDKMKLFNKLKVE